MKDTYNHGKCRSCRQHYLFKEGAYWKNEICPNCVVITFLTIGVFVAHDKPIFTSKKANVFHVINFPHGVGIVTHAEYKSLYRNGMVLDIYSGTLLMCIHFIKTNYERPG